VSAEIQLIPPPIGASPAATGPAQTGPPDDAAGLPAAPATFGVTLDEVSNSAASGPPATDPARLALRSGPPPPGGAYPAFVLGARASPGPAAGPAETPELSDLAGKPLPLDGAALPPGAPAGAPGSGPLLISAATGELRPETPAEQVPATATPGHADAGANDVAGDPAMTLAVLVSTATATDPATELQAVARTAASAPAQAAAATAGPVATQAAEAQAQQLKLPDDGRIQPQTTAQNAAIELPAANTDHDREAGLRHHAQPRANVSADSFATQAVSGTDRAIEFAEEFAGLRQAQAQRPLQATPGTEQWSRALGERLMLMADSQTQSARIKLHPEHLGPLDVRIQIEDSAARVWFGAHHGQTRDALEASIPRLRDMLADQGLNLVETGVSDGGTAHEQSRDRPEPARETPGWSGADSLADPGPASPGMMTRISSRLVDVYA